MTIEISYERHLVQENCFLFLETQQLDIRCFKMTFKDYPGIIMELLCKYGLIHEMRAIIVSFVVPSGSIKSSVLPPRSLQSALWCPRLVLPQSHSLAHQP